MGQDEAGTLAHLRTLHGERVDPKIAEHKGRIVKTTGDGILIEFRWCPDLGLADRLRLPPYTRSGLTHACALVRRGNQIVEDD